MQRDTGFVPNPISLTPAEGRAVYSHPWRQWHQTNKRLKVFVDEVSVHWSHWWLTGEKVKRSRGEDAREGRGDREVPSDAARSGLTPDGKRSSLGGQEGQPPRAWG